MATRTTTIRTTQTMCVLSGILNNQRRSVFRYSNKTQSHIHRQSYKRQFLCSHGKTKYSCT
jgi:hypothetical protein